MRDEDPSKRGSFMSISKEFDLLDSESWAPVGKRQEEDSKKNQIKIFQKRFSISDINAKKRVLFNN